MALRASVTKKVFEFNFTARTSRGRMKDRTSWFIKLWDESNPAVFGLGECAPLPGLSIDDKPDYEFVLNRVAESISTLRVGSTTLLQDAAALIPAGFPSILFGLETALLDFKNGGKRVIFDNRFLASKPIPINGLVWMGDLDLMLQQASIKIEEGFRCIKIKVGGLNFEKECDILHYIRRKYFREEITLRLDANGAFKTGEALYKLYDLSKFKIHSIEQPIKPGQPELEELCRKSPIPIALDEEMIDRRMPGGPRHRVGSGGPVLQARDRHHGQAARAAWPVDRGGAGSRREGTAGDVHRHVRPRRDRSGCSSHPARESSCSPSGASPSPTATSTPSSPRRAASESASTTSSG